MNQTLNYALRYLKMGLSVIPLKPKSKIAAIDWKEYQKRRATDTEVRAWFATQPFNVGIVTGSVSNLVVLDLDGPNGLAFAQKHGVKSSLVSLTGSGKHLWYQHVEGIKNSASAIAPGVDVRGEGGYIVAPPSLHENGKAYRFATAPMFARLPDFPTGLIGATPATDSHVKPDNWLDEALKEIKNGHIHNTLVSVLGKFRAHNFSEQATYDLLQTHTTAGGMSGEDLRSKITEIWGRYEPNERPTVVGGVDRRGSGLVIRSPSNDNDWQQYQSRSELDTTETFRTGFKTLDKMLEGGLKSERAFTIAARTGTGKTNFAIALSRSLCQQGKKVLYFSTEFTYRKIWDRYISLAGSQDAIRRDPFMVVDSFSPNLEQVEEAIRQANPDVFIFDHVNHLGEEREALGSFMQGCNFLQRKYNAQAVIVAQLNRQADWVENGERVHPRMSMIKGSGTIEQASSRILLLSETKVLPEGNEILGVLDKNDSGEKGIIQFMLKKHPYRIEEI